MPVEKKVGANGAAVEEKALEYIKHCTANPRYKPEVVKRAVELGDDLLKVSGSLEGAMEGLRQAREFIIGRPTAGAGDPCGLYPQNERGGHQHQAQVPPCEAQSKAYTHPPSSTLI